jgi:hypothetical protein
LARAAQGEQRLLVPGRVLLAQSLLLGAVGDVQRLGPVGVAQIGHHSDYP